MQKVLISEYVRKLRKESGLSANEFAKQHGVSHSQIAKYEDGKLDNPSLAVASKFCKNFDMTPDEFLGKIKCDNEVINNTSNFISSVEHLMSGNYLNDFSKDVGQFFDKYKEQFGFTAYEKTTNKLPMDETVVVPMNGIITKGNKPILVSYFPYRKVPYDRSPFKYYSDLNTALGSIYLNADLKKNINFLFMTPSYEAYKYFADRNYRQISDQNIIIIYYKYRRDIEYTLITGKDFLK